ncbi:MAG: amidohydrolase [Marinilabiliales bacterium]|nr:MAG: amidohydrolase [Marinilabiliales bacterium]
MLKNLQISCIQTDLFWEDIDQNLKHFENKLSLLPEESEMVILPEMFTTGFSMNSTQLAEEMSGKSFQWMKNQAEKINKIVVGSIIVKEKDNYFNRCISMFPNGNFYTYDKGHLFRMEREHIDFTKGESKTIFKHNGWRVCTLICYDLRFPVWSRNKGDYDLLIYIASWPESRREVWNTLLKARAIENQAYAVGVNRIGKDGEGISYAGDTVIIDPKGQIIKKASDYKDEIISAELSLVELNRFREKFPVFLDADDFKLL